MKQDFLAIILIGCGSSYARGPDLEDTVKRVVNIAFSDWRTLYDLSEKDVSVNVYDVTGHDKVYWDARGVWVDNPDGEDFLVDRLELRQAKFPKAPKKRR